MFQVCTFYAILILSFFQGTERGEHICEKIIRFVPPGDSFGIQLTYQCGHILHSWLRESIHSSFSMDLARPCTTHRVAGVMHAYSCVWCDMCVFVCVCVQFQSLSHRAITDLYTAGELWRGSTHIGNVLTRRKFALLEVVRHYRHSEIWSPVLIELSKYDE